MLSSFSVGAILATHVIGKKIPNISPIFMFV